MNRIYFDTEFEGLTEDAALISIGLTNATGTHHFYAELSDTYKVERCNDFCRSMVLPLLEHGHTKMNSKQLSMSLREWLAFQGKNTILICDSPRDIKQIEKIFPDGLPPNCSFEILSFAKKWERTLANKNRRIYKKYRLRDHHALDDAIVNRIIFEGR
jgi:hypothetical protein